MSILADFSPYPQKADIATTARGRQLEHYGVISNNALRFNTLTLLEALSLLLLIHSGHIGAIIDSYSHRWASTSTSISAISDIRHRHLLFRYRKKICRTENCHSDIGRVPISTSESIPISDIQKIFFTSAGFEPKTLVFSATVLIYEFLDVRYQISDKSLFRYPI
jgi:hypothetical protein